MTSHPKTAGEVLGDHGPVEVKRRPAVCCFCGFREDNPNGRLFVAGIAGVLICEECAAFCVGAVAQRKISQPTKEGEGK